LYEAHCRPHRTAVIREAALASWLAQLALNLAWSVVFFGARNVGGGLVVIVALLAAILLLPYLAWTAFAAALNARIWQLNR
jgi:benzodiazapine receptor